MVKKLVKQSSLSKAITKNHHENKQLNNLIEVLRPKVYITDVSNFKKLVQDLTGNGAKMISMPSPPPPPPDPIQIPSKALDYNNVPVLIDVDEDHHRGELQSCTEAISFDASLDSFDDYVCNNVGFSSTNEWGLLTEAHNQMHVINDTTFVSSMDEQWADLLACQDLESWLLDSDQPFPNNNLNGFAQDQEVSVHDYEYFSGRLIS